ncbi:hypothetical protein L571_2555 [Bordetella pertussis 2371640]|nr:hypothetical protein L571_2555 [Bordetella pertussis 2371640]
MPRRGPPRRRAPRPAGPRCTHLQTQPGRIQPIDSSQLDPVQTARRPAPG